MRKYVECSCMSDFEEKFGRLQEQYRHVEFVAWRGDARAEVFCLL